MTQQKWWQLARVHNTVVLTDCPELLLASGGATSRSVGSNDGWDGLGLALNALVCDIGPSET